jgi:hypothetical protein
MLKYLVIFDTEKMPSKKFLGCSKKCTETQRMNLPGDCAEIGTPKRT